LIRKTLLICLILAAAGSARAQESTTASTASTLTLHEAFQRALTANPSVGRARAEVDVAEAQKRAFFSAVLPRISASGSAIRNTEEVTFGSGTDARTILPQNDWNYRVTLNQPIYAGFREKRAYDQAKLSVSSAREGVRSAEDQLLVRVAADYLAVVAGDTLTNVEQQNVDLARNRLTQAQNLFDAGEVTRVEIVRAEAAVKAAQRRVVGAQQARETAAGRLRIDLDIDTPIGVSDTTVNSATSIDEAALIQQAAGNRPELKQAENNLLSAKLEVAKQKGAYLPILTMDAAWISQKSTFPADSYGQAALRLTVPIYQGGEIGARIAAARGREEQARLALAEQQQIVREDVRKALLDLRAAETSLALATDQQKAAEAEYEQIFESYKAQEATSLDVQSSESNLADARRAVATNKLDLDLARLRVSFVVGNLKQQVLTEAAQ
jgi:outer membrane protein